MPTIHQHPVLFVGAGPGDPELITVKGQKALAEADVVIYAGSLVPEAVLRWAPPEAEKHNSAGMDLDAIINTIHTAWSSGARVVRLHTGDPSLYGAIFEQMARLDDLNITYEVIPGVTAAFAAAAAMRMEYTLPEVTQTLILTRMAGRTPVPEAENLAALAAHGASMAIYLSIGQIEQVADILAAAHGPDAPCAVAYRVSQPDEKIRFTRIDRLVETVRAENIARQAIIIAGPAVAHRLTPESGAAVSRLYDAGFAHGFRDASRDAPRDAYIDKSGN